MNGVHLRFYTIESRRIRRLLVHEWLLDQAKNMGIPGGSAFRAMAGYGRHGRMHEQHFFELAQEPVLVEFILSTEQANTFLALIEKEGLHLFYAKLPAQFGIVGADDETMPETVASSDTT
jgi:PII-like signaling protein